MCFECRRANWRPGLYSCESFHIRNCASPEGMRVTVPLYEAKAELFRTLGHPVRIRVLELLSEKDHAVHELLADSAVEPSALSQQLAVLRRTGLVRRSTASCWLRALGSTALSARSSWTAWSFSLRSSSTRMRTGWPRVRNSSALASYSGTVTRIPSGLAQLRM